MYREAKAQHGGDPVAAWARHRRRPAAAPGATSRARGKGGLVRATWDEAIEIVAAAHVHTIKKYGPDRVAGFSPIPAMSMVSHASGARFIDADRRLDAVVLRLVRRPAVASPQVFGDQTDVPESGDWWNAGYLIMWGSNVPVTRTPDAHWMTEARYRGQKVVAVAPDYADNVKFADEWLPAQPGTDGALAMAMGHVMLKEFFVDRQTPYFTDYVQDVHRPAAPGHARARRGDGAYAAGKFLTAADLAGRRERRRTPRSRPCSSTRATGEPVVPNGSLGFRYGEAGVGQVEPRPRRRRPACSRCSTPTAEAGRRCGCRASTPPTARRRDLRARRAGAPRRRPPGHHRVRPDARAVRRRPRRAAGRRGRPAYDDAADAVHAGLAGGDHRRARRSGRAGSAASSPQNAEESGGRSMIVMGAGTNHWFHSDTIYRAFLALTTLTGCQGVNGGGWAHYVGQEKVPPDHRLGAARLRASTGTRPPRQMIQTAYWYLHTDQFRYDHFGADTLAAPTGEGQLAGQAHRRRDRPVARGWAGCRRTRTFDRNPLDLADEAAAAGQAGRRRTSSTSSGPATSSSPARTPTRPENYPRVLVDLAGQPARLLRQGQRVLPQAPARHRLVAAGRPRRREGQRPATCAWRDEAPEGKLDLLLTLDFRHDQHHDLLRRRAAGGHLVREARPQHHRHAPVRALVQPGDRAAVADPHRLGRLADDRRRSSASWPPTHLGVRKDVVAVPLHARHPGRDGQPARRRPRLEGTASASRCPGVTMPKLVEVERDYGAVADEDARARPAGGHARRDHQGRHLRRSTSEVDYLRAQERRGARRRRPTAGRRSKRDVDACEAILALSGTTNGHLATQGFKTLEKRTGSRLADLAAEHEGKQITFADTQAAAGAGDHLAGVVGLARPAGGATRRSPSTSSGTSRGTR